MLSKNLRKMIKLPQTSVKKYLIICKNYAAKIKIMGSKSKQIGLWIDAFSLSLPFSLYLTNFSPFYSNENLNIYFESRVLKYLIRESLRHISLLWFGSNHLGSIWIAIREDNYFCKTKLFLNLWSKVRIRIRVGIEFDQNDLMTSALES